ncbi:MAG: ribonuclease P protein component [Sphingobacteriales bacterium]
MLKKANRITKTRDLQSVYRKGKTLHTPALVIKFLPGLKFRVGLVVSKKISKKAVERNRIKRALREELRLNKPNLALGEYMLVAKPGASIYKNAALRADLVKSLKKAGIL